MLLSRDERMKLRNTKEFKNSNAPWNYLHLNSRNSVGSLMQLIKTSNCENFEEWESYYLNSGAIRKELLQKKYLNKLELKEINMSYGRTEEDLINIAYKLQKSVKLPIDTLYNFVYIRVIDETWIGYNREQLFFEKVKEILKDKPEFSIKKTNSDIDTNYAVDFEIYKNKKLIIGIQLKSTRYSFCESNIMKETKNFNSRKNNNYTKLYKVPVKYFYIDVNTNEILNLSDIYKIFNM